MGKLRTVALLTKKQPPLRWLVVHDGVSDIYRAQSIGLSARPTKVFVQKVGTFPCKVSVIKGDKKVNGKSSLSMLTLGIQHNDQVTLEIEGEQEEQALAELGALLTHIYEE